MGGSSWSADVSSLRSASFASSADRFTYSHVTMDSVPASDWKVHKSLDPMNVKFRESRDSDEHPTSLAIAVMCDVTGSMSTVPAKIIEKIPGLMGLLLRKGYVEHPQLLFGAIGDATCDRVPLQVGQFESDNRMETNLEDVFLEAGGGGQQTESYELAAYFFARHTSLDCYEKRGKRGYLFIIGDETNYPNVSHREVEKVIGDTIQSNIPTEDIYAELKKMYDVYFIFPSASKYGMANDKVAPAHWQNIVGQNFIRLNDTSDIAETIALTIGLAEGAVDIEEAEDHLKEIGTADKSISDITTALAAVGSGASITRSTGDSLPLSSSGASRI